MKKIVALLLALLLCATAVALAEGKVTKVTLSESTVNVYAGYSSEPITVTVSPADADDTEVKWKSSNEKVATVDENGVVTGVAPGNCKVTATAAGNSRAAASCAVKVSQPVTELSMKSSLFLQKGKAETLRVSQKPANAEKLSVTWKSSDSKVVTVKEGKVTAVNCGKATVTASVKLRNGAVISADCEVEVVTPVTKLELAKYSMTVHVGSSKKAPDVTISPKSATYSDLEWQSENPKIATVDEEGRVTGVKSGTTKIKVYSSKKNGARVNASFTVKVVQPVTEISMKESMKLAVGKSASLDAKAEPEKADNKQKKFKSSNEKVATVNNNGKVTAVAAGSCTITCTAEDGAGAEATCEVTVYQPVTKLSAGSTKVSMLTGSTQELSVNVSPKDVTDPSLTWTCSNEEVAKVEDGVVTALAAGTCTVTCATNDGTNLSVEFTLTIEPAQPLTIINARREAEYGGDENCLFVDVVNNCAFKTIQSFVIHVTLYNEAGEVQHVYACEWTKSFGAVKPGETANSGYWHWYNLKDLMDASCVEIAVTSVTFADGSRQAIDKADRVSVAFFGDAPAKAEEPAAEEQPADEEPAEEEAAEEESSDEDAGDEAADEEAFDEGDEDYDDESYDEEPEEDEEA